MAISELNGAAGEQARDAKNGYKRAQEECNTKMKEFLEVYEKTKKSIEREHIEFNKEACKYTLMGCKQKNQKNSFQKLFLNMKN